MKIYNPGIRAGEDSSTYMLLVRLMQSNFVVGVKIHCKKECLAKGTLGAAKIVSPISAYAFVVLIAPPDMSCGVSCFIRGNGQQNGVPGNHVVKSKKNTTHTCAVARQEK